MSAGTPGDGGDSGIGWVFFGGGGDGRVLVVMVA